MAEPTYSQARALRELADALDRQREAKTLPGISAPRNINFYYETPGDLDSYANNPTLLKAVEREIRISWEELRSRALARLDDSVQQLSAQVGVFVAGQLTPPAPSQTDGDA